MLDKAVQFATKAHGSQGQRKLTVIVEIFRDCEGGELEMSDQDFVKNKLPLKFIYNIDSFSFYY